MLFTIAATATVVQVLNSKPVKTQIEHAYNMLSAYMPAFPSLPAWYKPLQKVEPKKAPRKARKPRQAPSDSQVLADMAAADEIPQHVIDHAQQIVKKHAPTAKQR